MEKTNELLGQPNKLHICIPSSKPGFSVRLSQTLLFSVKSEPHKTLVRYLSYGDLFL